MNKEINDLVGTDYILHILQSDDISEVRIFVLGPEGTNISQAAHKWAVHCGISKKVNIILCDTPEQEVEAAVQVREEGVIPIFALCAVYYNLCKVFFRNLDSYMFLHHYYMQLDNMQLASKNYTKHTLKDNALVAAHYSPSILLEATDYVIKDTSSNSAAARLCAEGEVDACITTETACKLYDLNTIKEFGSPNMLFTFGTTKFGMDEILKTLKKMQMER